MSRVSKTELTAKEAVLNILRAADRIGRYFQRLMEPWGLTSQQFNVLRILRGAGPQGLPTLEVGERMIERTPGVTRLLHLGAAERAQQRIDFVDVPDQLGPGEPSTPVNSSSSWRGGAWAVSPACSALRRLPRAALA